MNIHIDSNIGVYGFKIHWMRSKCGKLHWCRRAISIMGTFNTSMEYLSKTSPFDPLFNDNYVEGKGSSKQEALDSMYIAEKEMSDGLWVV